MSTGIAAYIEERHLLIERALHSRLPVSHFAGAERLNEAVAYAVLGGGKRMRPVLAMLAAGICGAPPEAALPVGCALEFVHAASLALDDLPAMDDAALRRGRPALHLRHGQDMAILAAVALLNEAYAIFSDVPGLVCRAIREIGVNGMVGGQAADLRDSHSPGRMEKTTALTRLTMIAGAAAAGAGAADADALAAFGHALGEAYQICDDIADAAAREFELGKTAGQDRRHGRSNLVAEVGAAAACKHAHDIAERACHRLRAAFGDRPETALLEEFARSIVERGLLLVR